MMMLFAFYFIFIYGITINYVNSQKFIGDSCILQSTGQLGECVLILDCPKALSDLQQQRYPQNCGFQGTAPIVCCPKGSSSNSNTPPTPRPTPRPTPLPTPRPTPQPTRRPITDAPPTRPPSRPSSNNRIPGEISRQKCVEYGKYVYSKKKPVILLLDAPEATTNECGFNVEPLVVGGTEAKTKEFPHQASIGFEDTSGSIRWGCGGTILSEEYILTAGHCLYDIELKEPKYVKVGLLRLTDTDNVQTFNIAELIRHPEYKPPIYYNDIGLIRLERPIKLNPYARPACLFTRDSIPTDSAIATGWGNKAFLGSGSEILLKVVLQFSPRNKCTSVYTSDRRLPQGLNFDSQICAGTGENDKVPKDTCQGDSGGPFQIYHVGDDVKCMYDVIGVTSFGKACGYVPGIYTKVSNYIKWIEDIVWP